MPEALFLTSQLGLAAFGAALAFHPSLRDLPRVSRLSAAFLAGAWLLSIEATLFSLVRLRWTVWSLALPLILVSAVLARRWIGEERGAKSEERPTTRRSSLLVPRSSLLGWVIGAVSVIHLIARIVTGRSISMDYLFFWGVKAARFAFVGGIEHEFLRWQFAIHAHPNYPPLFPVTLAWSALVAGGVPWLGAALTSVVWVVATVPLLYALLRIRVPTTHAVAVSSFWTAALSISLAHSFSGGNAESMLVCFVTIAAAALVVESRQDELNMRVLAAVCLAGAVATKNEGLLAWLILVVAAIARDLWWSKSHPLRRAGWLLLLPMATYALWLCFELVYDVPLRDPTRESGWSIHLSQAGAVAASMLRYLNAGTFGLAWILPLGFAVAMQRQTNREQWLSVMPAVGTALALLLAFALYYLRSRTDPSELIGWTLPRLSQPALSLWILGFGVATCPGQRDLG